MSGWADSTARNLIDAPSAFLTPSVEAVQAYWAGLGTLARSVAGHDHRNPLGGHRPNRLGITRLMGNLVNGFFATITESGTAGPLV